MVLKVQTAPGVWEIVGGQAPGLDVAEADARYVNVAGDAMIGPLILAADPVNPMEAATKRYVDTVVHFGGNRATASYPAGVDSAITPITITTNLGGFVVAGSTITVPSDGTYCVSASIGGAGMGTWSSGLMINCPGQGSVMSGPAGTGTAWRSGNTMMFTATPSARACTFTFRNQHTAAVSLSFSVEILKLAL